MEENFDRFVAVKASNDGIPSPVYSFGGCLTRLIALYAEMREGLLSDEAEYASKPLRDHLKRE